jgi:predicted MFS family arabinose efflux permease
LIDLFWPLFGSGVVCGALLSSRVRATIDRRLLLATAYAIQALGIGLGVAWPSEAGFAIGSLLLGLPFTTITLFALQETRRIRPHNATPTMGLVTTLYAIGQALGPALVAALLAVSGGDAHLAFQRALVIAAASLLLGAAMYVSSTRAWPLSPSPASGRGSG